MTEQPETIAYVILFVVFCGFVLSAINRFRDFAKKAKVERLKRRNWRDHDLARQQLNENHAP